MVHAARAGSSPRVWGQAALHFCAYQNHGIIPTRMGTRKVSLQYVNTIRDHPHAYGDKYILKTLKHIILGSSPRVWGQVFDGYYIHNDNGIIPTRMGTSNSKLHTKRIHPNTFHPGSTSATFHRPENTNYWQSLKSQDASCFQLQ